MKMKKWKLEVKVYKDGKPITTTISKANGNEIEGCTETEHYDIWIERFSDLRKAVKLAERYKA
jgi:macrodomain Ter protein organizer (MatP/YcbG family)